MKINFLIILFLILSEFFINTQSPHLRKLEHNPKASGESNSYTAKARKTEALTTGFGNCSFKWTKGSQKHLVGVSHDIYQNSLACGGCMLLKANGKEITAYVTDSVGDGEKNINISPNDLNTLGYTDLGDVTWEWVVCPDENDDKVEFDWANGANERYFALQVLNIPVRVKNMEVKIKDNYITLERQTHNVFVLQDQNQQYYPFYGPYDIRITFIDDTTLKKNITAIPGVTNNNNTSNTDDSKGEIPMSKIIVLILAIILIV